MDELIAIAESLKTFYIQLGVFLFRIFIVFFILIAGWAIANAVRKIITKVLKLLRVDDLSEKIGVEDFLIRGGVPFTAVTLIAKIVYWSIMASVLLATLNVLGLHTATGLLNELILYLPNVIASMLIIVFGGFIAKGIQMIVSTYLVTIGMTNGDMIGNVTKYIIMIFVVLIALEHLSIGGTLLESAFQIVFAAICFGLALAFGLGGKELAARLLDMLVKKNSK